MGQLCHARARWKGMTTLLLGVAAFWLVGLALVIALCRAAARADESERAAQQLPRRRPGQRFVPQHDRLGDLERLKARGNVLL